MQKWTPSSKEKKNNKNFLATSVNLPKMEGFLTLKFHPELTPVNSSCLPAINIGNHVNFPTLFWMADVQKGSSSYF